MGVWRVNEYKIYTSGASTFLTNDVFHELVFSNGVNKEVKTWRDPKSPVYLYVECEEKPKDSVLFGVKWEEVE